MKTQVIKSCLIAISMFLIVFLLVSCSFSAGESTTEEYVEHNTGNIYLYEEIIFADEIYMKCIGIKVVYDEEGNYVLKLQLQIEQWTTDFNVNQQTISPEMFELRMVDMNRRSATSVFIESLAKATISVAASTVIGGEVNVIEETLDFASDYISSSIENSELDEGMSISAHEDSFVEFDPYEINGELTFVELSFTLTDDFLSSTKTMVLSLDTANRIERNIFLVLRPNTEAYLVNFDLNGGSPDTDIDSMNMQPGVIGNIPDLTPKKQGYQFVYWTTEKDNPATKIRNIYFYSYEENESFTLYAYYQEEIPLAEYVNIGEPIVFKGGTYEISIESIFFEINIDVLNEDEEMVELEATEGKIFLGVNINIDKVLEGEKHTLDNDDDFYLENDYVGEGVSDYYGYIKGFESLKPIDDYTWIGLEIIDIGEYQITIYFEVPEEYNLTEVLMFLEVDFFRLGYAKSILLQ